MILQLKPALAGFFYGSFNRLGLIFSNIPSAVLFGLIALLFGGSVLFLAFRHTIEVLVFYPELIKSMKRERAPLCLQYGRF
jgi:xanthine/uracil permease